MRRTGRRNRSAVGTEPATSGLPPIRTLINDPAGPEIGLPPGTYHERISLERPVTLTAREGAGTVKLFVENGTALTVSSGATVQGLVIETYNQASPALLITGGSPVFEECEVLGGRVEAAGDASPTFRRCRICATALAGLYATGRSRLRLENCVLADVQGNAVAVTGEAMVWIFATKIAGAEGAGVRVHDGARAALEGCTISGCQGPGLLVEEHAAVLLRSCEIADAGAEGVRVDGSSALAEGHAPARPAEFAGDNADAASLATMIQGVTLLDCKVSGVAGEGIVAAAGDVRLRRARITAARIGVLAGGTAQIELQDGAITDAAVHGLVVHGAARLHALRLAVTRCGENGVIAAEDAAIELVDSQCTGTARAAVDLDGHATAEAVGCWIGTTPEQGVQVSGNAMLTLSDSVVDACGQNGIQVGGCGDATLRRCMVSNSRSGILLATPHHPVLDGCTVTGIQQIGIEIGAGTSPLLRGCRVIGAGSAGIFVGSHSTAQLDDCFIERAGDCGLVICTDAEPQVRNTTVADTKKNDLFVRDSGRGLLENAT